MSKAVSNCARCHYSGDIFRVRAEHLCSICVQRYVATKVLKRLQTNKIRAGFNEPEKLILVPISFGVSSLSLLHVLDSQLNNRQEQGRHAGYTLHLLHVNQSSVSENAVDQEKAEALKRKYSSFPFTTLCLEDCFDYGIDFDNLLERKLDVMVEGSSDNLHRLKYVLSAASSPTSRIDIIDIIRHRLTAAFAQKLGCSNILYGDTTTRLAERTLSDTAKGRGDLLPWLTSDGTMSDGIFCSYPLRDLLKKELNIYASIVRPPMNSLIVDSRSPNQAVSFKDNSIDRLMGQYFEAVEQNYPGIVANVVKTTSKLRAPPINSNTTLCEVCRYPIVNGAWAGNQQGTSPTKLGEASNNIALLCYGCAQTLEIT